MRGYKARGHARHGGVGKSVLANLLAHDRKIREAFPDGIVWVGLGSQPILAKQMRDVHRGLGGDGAFETDYEGKTKLKELLAEKAVLLVLDDAWRRSDVDAFDVLGPRCRALITTRDASLLTSLGGTHHVVELLTDAEALRLLAVSVGKEVNELPAEAIALLKECGRLPLAVALAGGMIAAGMPWADLLDALRSHRLEFLSDEHRPDQHQNLWKMIEVSFKALNDDEQHRLIELAVFPEDETVPDAAVATLWESTGQLTGRLTRSLLGKLKQRSLLQLTAPKDPSATSVGHVSLHGLIFDYCVLRAQVMLGGVSALHERLLTAYRAKCREGWASGPNDGYFFNHLREHLIATRRGGELVDLLEEPHWLEAKLVAGLGYDLLKDFAHAQAVAAASGDLSAIERAAVDRCALIGRLLGNVIDLVQVEPSSVTAQLLLELQEHSATQTAGVPPAMGSCEPQSPLVRAP